MTTIVDRRNIDRHKSSENRKRFIDRCRGTLKKAVREQINSDKNSVGNPAKSRNVKVNKDTIEEPTFTPDPQTGHFQRIFPGNRRYNKGDTILKPEASSGKGGQAGTTDKVWKDEFEFVLTKDEFFDLLFEDLELPNFLKKSLKKSTSLVRQRAGYTKDGIPAMISLKKTMENAIARRIASRAENPDSKPPYLDDVDVRYKRFANVPRPDKQAIMFCVMDVSGSMGQDEKMVAKNFFIILHLFLEKMYKNVQLVFIRHHTIASEVDEETFFTARETGGTLVSPAYELINTIIEARYPVDSNNIYVAHASDGDNDMRDNIPTCNILRDKLLPKVSYMTYINISLGRDPTSYDLGHIFGSQMKDYRNFKSKYVFGRSDLYPVLYDLFKKGGAIE